MQVLKDSPVDLSAGPRAMTIDAMQKDFEYMMAQKFTKAMYEKGLISFDEMNRIMELNKEKFSPFYKEIMC